MLPPSMVGQGVNRFALTISLGMATGPFIGIQVRNHLSSKASFIVLFVLTVVALICVSFCRIEYPKVERKKFVLADAFYKPALPFMFNMMFIMIPFGAVIVILRYRYWYWFFYNGYVSGKHWAVSRICSYCGCVCDWRNDLCSIC